MAWLDGLPCVDWCGLLLGITHRLFQSAESQLALFHAILETLSLRQKTTFLQYLQILHPHSGENGNQTTRGYLLSALDSDLRVCAVQSPQHGENVTQLITMINLLEPNAIMELIRMIRRPQDFVVLQEHNVASSSLTSGSAFGGASTSTASSTGTMIALVSTTADSSTWTPDSALQGPFDPGMFDELYEEDVMEE